MAEVYDGFISYSHSADDLLAPRLQSALQRFAKPWWKRRAVRIFRDESSLSANPHLWSSITEALDTSGWFVLLLSPDAAESEWVNQEIAYWLEHRDAKKILPVVTDGTFGWADDVMTGSAVPEALQGVFSEEPRWVDLRFAKGEEQLDLNNPTFSAAVADVASAIRGVPKDELESEEVRQHRRTVRTAWTAGGLVTVLAVAAIGFGIQSARNADEAERQATIAAEQAEIAEANAESEAAARSQAEFSAKEATRQAKLAQDERDLAQAERDRADAQARVARAEALAANSIALLGDDPELSVLLAAGALDLDARPAGLSAMHSALQAHRTIFQVAAPDLGIGSAIGGLSPDGTRLVVGGSFGTELAAWDVDTGEHLWTHQPGGEQAIITAAFTIDGQQVVAYTVGLPDVIRFELQILDAESGEPIRDVPVPDCSGWHYWPAAVPPYVDLSQPMVWTRDLDCDHLGTIEAEVGLLSPQTGEFKPLREIQAGVSAAVGMPTSDRSRSLIAVDDTEGEDGLIINTSSGVVVDRFGGGIATISADGSHLLSGGVIEAPLELRDLNSGQVLWRFSTEGDVFTRAWFSDDETLVYGTNFDGSTYVLDAATGTVVHRLRGHTGFQREVVMSTDNSRIATFAADGTARVWNIGSSILSEAAAFALYSSGHPERLHGFKSLEVAAQVAVAWAGTATRLENADWEVAVLDLTSEEVLYLLTGGSPSLAPDGKRLAYRTVEDVALTDEQLRDRAPAGDHRQVGDILVIDVESGESLYGIPVECHTYLAGGVAVPAAGCEGKEFRPDWLRIWDLEWSSDGSLLASIDGGDGRAQVFDVATGHVVWSSSRVAEYGPSQAEVIAFSPDDRFFVVGYTNTAAISIYEVGTFDLIAEVAVTDLVMDMEFTADGQFLVAGDVRGFLRVISVETWTEVKTLEAHRAGAVFHVSTSPAGSLIVSLSGDGVRVWNSSDGSLNTEIPMPDARGVEFIDEGHLLVIPLHPSNAITIVLDPVELSEAAHDKVTRAFSETECLTYSIDPCPTLDDLQGG